MKPQTRKTLLASTPAWAVLAVGTYAVGLTPITATCWALSILAAIYGISTKETA